MLILNPPAEITPGVWMLGTTAYPLYLIRGSAGSALVEGGVGVLAGLLLRQFDELKVARDSLRQLVLTHAHPDHVMAIPRLREHFPQAAVLASAIAAATLKVEKAIAFFRQVDDALTATLTKSGAAAAADQPAPFAGTQIVVDQIIGAGDEIRLGDAVWQVLATPGHSDCSISLHDRASGVLIISDASGYYMPDRGGWWPNYFSSYKDYMASMERLASLDAETVCLSHNGAIRGKDEVRAYFAGAIAATRAYHERIVAAAKAGQAVRQIAEELGGEIHAQTGVLPLDFFQKNCGLLVKQSLKAEGISA